MIIDLKVSTEKQFLSTLMVEKIRLTAAFVPSIADEYSKIADILVKL